MGGFFFLKNRFLKIYFFEKIIGNGSFKVNFCFLMLIINLFWFMMVVFYNIEYFFFNFF